MRATVRQSHQFQNLQMLPRSQRSRLLMQLKGRKGCRLGSVRGLVRRLTGRKEEAASPPAKKKGVLGREVLAALQVRASPESLSRLPRRRGARKSQVALPPSRQIQIRRRLGTQHHPENC